MYCTVTRIFFLTALTLQAVCHELGRIKSQWFNIGIQLGIPQYKLKEFEKEIDPLSAVMDYWLQGNVEQTKPRSWKSIVEVLKSDHVGQPGLAETIRKKYCQQEENKVEKGQN